MATHTKYQIFVSSTYEDLKTARDQVVKAILEMGHIPVGMEMFSAGDSSQWELIKRQIESSDYYVVIVAHRYGSLDGNTSYTEKEHDFATSLGIPVLGFVLEDGAAWPHTFVDKDPHKTASLSAFKDKLKQRIISFWSSQADLHGKVSVALMKQFAATPREGWVKASEAASPQMVAELARLSQENGELRAALQKIEKREQAGSEEALIRTVEVMENNSVQINIFYKGAKDWTDEGERSLIDLFWLVAPELLIEKAAEATGHYVATLWRKQQDKPLREHWACPSNSVKTWFSDLAALSLVEPSKKKHQVADKDEYWSLTDEGKRLYYFMRKTRLERESKQKKEQAAKASSPKQ